MDDALKKNSEQVKASHFLNAFDGSFYHHSLQSLLVAFTWYLSQFEIILIICPFAFYLPLSRIEYESTGMGPISVNHSLWQLISTQLICCMNGWMNLCVRK